MSENSNNVEFETRDNPWIRQFRLSGAPPFAKSMSFDFHSKANVIIGPNGLGKSTVLRHFAQITHSQFVHRPPDSAVTIVTEPPGAAEEITTVYIGPTRTSLEAETILRDVQILDFSEKVKRALTTMNSSARVISVIFFVLLLLSVVAHFGGIGPSLFEDIDPFFVYALLMPWAVIMYLGFASGLFLLALRRMLPTFASRNLQLASMLANETSVTSAFLFRKVETSTRLLMGTDDKPKQDNESYAAMDAANLALQCAKDIAPEVFSRDAKLHTAWLSVPNKGVHRILNGFQKERAIAQHMFEVDTKHSPEPLHISSLSSGTQGPFLIVWYLALRLAYANGFQPGWENKPVALFIDELENHLHPTWQRRFIPVLLGHFPGLQIFASTHSPFAVAGLKAGQVHQLFRGDDGTIRVRKNSYDLVGWTADEILNEYLEVTDPTDLTTAQAVEVLRWLQNMGDLDDDLTAEEWRNEELAYLDEAVSEGVADDDEILGARWLRGEIVEPVVLTLPLKGSAEQWRLAVIEQFQQIVGVDILSGGAAARLRELYNERIANNVAA